MPMLQERCLPAAGLAENQPRPWECRIVRHQPRETVLCRTRFELLRSAHQLAPLVVGPRWPFKFSFLARFALGSAER